MSLSADFERARRRLFGLAYRMLGSAADAEDVVQETFVRASRASADEIRSPEAFFIAVATRLCLDQLKSARRRREIYVGPWLPEPIPDTDGMSPERAAEFADDLSFALLLTLEKLTPAERAAFLLHDVFDWPFPEIARTLGRGEAACRQLASRARKAVRAERSAGAASRPDQEALLQAFLAAVITGDEKALALMLTEDCVAFSDGGGVVRAALRPIHGPQKVSRFFVGLARKGRRLGATPEIALGESNGAPALIMRADGAVTQILSIQDSAGRIKAIYLVSNPQKLKAMEI